MEIVLQTRQASFEEIFKVEPNLKPRLKTGRMIGAGDTAKTLMFHIYDIFLKLN